MKNTPDQNIDYWLFSNATQPTLARARNDIPTDIVSGLTAEQTDKLCAKIRKRLANKQFCEIYVKLLVLFRDRSALPVLRELQRYYTDKHQAAAHIGGDFTSWIQLLAEAIDCLTRGD